MADNWISAMIERFKYSSRNVSKKSLLLSKEKKLELIKEIDFESFENLFLLVVNGVLDIDISIKKIDIREGAGYINWRKNVLARDNYTCKECGANNNLEVHHIKPLKFYPELATNLENGLTLCNKCHKETDSYGYRVISKYGREC